MYPPSDENAFVHPTQVHHAYERLQNKATQQGWVLAIFSIILFVVIIVMMAYHKKWFKKFCDAPEGTYYDSNGDSDNGTVTVYPRGHYNRHDRGRGGGRVHVRGKSNSHGKEGEKDMKEMEMEYDQKMKNKKANQYRTYDSADHITDPYKKNEEEEDDDDDTATTYTE
jgi:hypothetical protein